MSDWTDSAKRALEEHLDRSRARFAAQGAEAEEVVEDIRRHVEEELNASRLGVVTEADVKRVLAAIDPQGGGEADSIVDPKPTEAPSRAPKRVSVFIRGLLWFFGVILPAGTLALELVTRMCAGDFFDPIPTWFHVLLVALVPMANAAALLMLEPAVKLSIPRWFWWTQSLAVGIAFSYALLFLPMTPFAVIGILFLGFGFIPLSPLLSWWSAFYLGRAMRSQAKAGQISIPSRTWLAALAAPAILVILQVPGILTDHWMEEAASPLTKDRNAAIRRLRNFGDEEHILRVAYGHRSPGLREIGLGNGPSISEKDAQEIYFRVTGRPFNAVRPGLSKVRGRGRAIQQEFEWDQSLGGSAVAGVVSGLSMMSSRLDAMAHAADGWGYTEWTIEFRNNNQFQEREARAVVQLPPGGVVSRVTLWVNGEEREAAFAGRSQARAAYQSVAVVQRRDPILVTSAGPDRVLMQCFPVPRNGGVMKIRLGITQPLALRTPTEAGFAWPRIVERNFAVRDDLRHHAWLELLDGSATPPSGWQTDAARRNTFHTSTSEADVDSALGELAVARSTVTTSAWAKDERSSELGWVRQQVETKQKKSLGRLAIVVDAGSGAGEWAKALNTAIEQTPGSSAIGIWYVQDGVHELVKGDSVEFKEAARKTGSWSRRFVGGHDSVPALEAAWDWASGKPDGVVLWLHGPQPLALGDVASIRQRMDRSGGAGARVIDAPAEPGPNQLCEALESVVGYGRLHRSGKLSDDIARLFAQWNGLAPTHRWKIERASATSPAEASGSKHLVRLWAREKIEELHRGRRTDQAIDLAGRWQLVTAVSGAVVLETVEQFKQHGLASVDPMTAPTVVPEPGTLALLGLGLVMLLWLGRRKHRAARV